TGNNSATANTTVGSRSTDLTITKTASTVSDAANGSVVVPGREITYTITATNLGPSDTAASGAKITDTVPAGTTFARVNVPAASGWTCLPVSAGAAAGTVVTCTVTSAIAPAASSAGLPRVVTTSPPLASSVVNAR